MFQLKSQRKPSKLQRTTQESQSTTFQLSLLREELFHKVDEKKLTIHFSFEEI